MLKINEHYLKLQASYLFSDIAKRVAAFQNGYFVALCNRVGREDCLEFAGESCVCAPDGTVIARAGSGTEEILYAEVDPASCGKSHARQLFLRHRRPELYGRWLTR